MAALQSAPLLTLKLDVAFAAMLDIGATPHGRRRIAPITGGSFAGERLRGTVLPGGADWVTNRTDGVMVIDVRVALKTDDGALIYMAYKGSFKAPPEAMKRFDRGEPLDEGEYTLRILPSFETGAERYRWLNDLIAVGTGQRTAQGPIYTIFEIL